MSATNFNIQTVDAPAPIRQMLTQLSANISFERQSRKGANGWLFFGENRIHHQSVAIKFYDWGGGHRYHAEPGYLADINSNNVIQILDAAYVDDDYAYFVTPYLSKGDLDVEIARGVRGNYRAVALVRDILSGLSYLHARQLVHRDLKPQNILVSDDDNALIGDFGSVKKIPEGHTSVPGSGHSIIYRPPESVSTGEYGISGDIYQIGLALFQLLGGWLPYHESDWLNSRQLKRYRSLSDEIDKQIFANDCISQRIQRGRIVDLSSLPPWVCQPLRRTVSRACNVNSERRFQTCSSFLAHLSSIQGEVNDWRIEEGLPHYFGKCNYRILQDERSSDFFVEKDRGAGWRRNNSFSASSLEGLVAEIESQ